MSGGGGGGGPEILNFQDMCFLHDSKWGASSVFAEDVSVIEMVPAHVATRETGT
jgi:hypothetical protein